MQELIVLLILAVAVTIVIRHMAPRFFRLSVIRLLQKAAAITGCHGTTKKLAEKQALMAENTGCLACSGCPYPEQPPICKIRLHPENIPKP